MTDFENREQEGENTAPQTPETDLPKTETAGTVAESSPPEAAAVPEAAPIPQAVPIPEAAASAPAEPAPVPETAAPAPEKPASSPYGATIPHLTLEPDFAPPKEPEIPEPPQARDPFQNPQPPHAPEPPQPEPVYQQAPPSYGASQYGGNPYETPPQYYGAPQYGQPPQQPYYQQQYNVPPMGYNQKSRLAAGLLAILLGCFGVHNYYLGFNSRATVQLILSIAGIVTCGLTTLAMVVWGFIEGILILSSNGPHMYDGNGFILKD